MIILLPACPQYALPCSPPIGSCGIPCDNIQQCIWPDDEDPDVCNRMRESHTNGSYCIDMIADVTIVLYASSVIEDVVVREFTREFIKDIFLLLPIGAGADDTRVAFVVANETASMLSFDFNDGSSLTDILWGRIEVYEQPFTALSPFELMINYLMNGNGGNRPEAQDFVIVLTNDLAGGHLPVEDYLLEVVKDQAMVYAAGLTYSVPEDRLVHLSSYPHALGQTYFYVTDLNNHGAFSDQMVNVMCNYFTGST